MLRYARRLTSQVYTARAERKDYEYTPFSPENEPFALYLRGSNVHELLRGEAGLHRLTRGTTEDRRRELACVTVLPIPEPPPQEEPERLRKTLTRLLRTAPARDGDAFVRTHDEGKEHAVRDPRTGTRVSGVASVLKEGRIDEFLLANLRSRSRPPAKKPEKPRGLRTIEFAL